MSPWGVLPVLTWRPLDEPAKYVIFGDPFGTPGTAHRPSRYHLGGEAEPKERRIIKGPGATRAEKKHTIADTESVVQNQTHAPEGVCWREK